jgi:hypothetical protein
MNLNQALKYLKKYVHTDGDSGPRYYFRGQAYTVCRLASKIANGIRGTVSGLTTEDGLALMQHYGWVSPLIEVTGTIDVAVFFAFLGHEPGKESVIYVFDRKKAEEDIQFINHDFLLHRLEEGGLKCRWLKQDGYAITKRDHFQMDKVLKFDLKKSACLVNTVKFSFEAGNCRRERITWNWTAILCRGRYSRWYGRWRKSILKGSWRDFWRRVSM